MKLPIFKTDWERLCI